MSVVEKIKALKEQKKAIILAHYYQTGDIQDIADFVGDSLGLSQKAAESKADIIVFAGVYFMAETAKILNPGAKVLIPDSEAGCSLADSCPPDRFRAFLAQYPEHTVVSYVNCSAAIKTMSDVIVTSSNAVNIVESFPRDERIIFAPDRNLGGYINKLTGRNMVLWDGTCEVHDVLSTEKIIQLCLTHPEAKLIAHPECKAQVLELAAFVGSTTEMISFTRTDSAEKYIVATESGIIHQMKKESPEKEFIIVPSDETCACNDCPYMKLNTLEKIYRCLADETPEVLLDENIIAKAVVPIQRMLAISKQAKLIQ